MPGGQRYHKKRSSLLDHVSNIDTGRMNLVAALQVALPGTALAAFTHSSDMWTQESNAPMVQMGESQESMKAQPVGQVVRFSV